MRRRRTRFRGFNGRPGRAFIHRQLSLREYGREEEGTRAIPQARRILSRDGLVPRRRQSALENRRLVPERHGQPRRHVLAHANVPTFEHLIGNYTTLSVREDVEAQQERQKYYAYEYRERHVLLNQRLSTQIPRPFAILFARRAQIPAHRAHSIQTLALGHDIVDIPRHDLLYIRQIRVQLV